MSVSRFALGLSLAAFALTCAAPSAHASSFWSGTFNIAVYQYNGGGSIVSPGVSADPTVNTSLTVGNQLGSGTYTGDLNFNENVPGGVNEVGAFLKSGGGSWVFGSGTDPWQSANPLSSGGFAATSAFVITGSISSLTSGSGTIFSDDGAVLRQAGVNLGGNDLPQSATSANYLNLALGTFEILYIETNGLPANLIVKSDGTALSDVPLPAALPLFASGLGALGLLGWRRKRKNVAAIAA